MTKSFFTYNVIKLLLIVIFLFTGSRVLCQKTTLIDKVNCSAQLSNADRLFGEGFYETCAESVERILNNCNLTRSEKEHAYEILVKSYLEADDPGRAESVAEIMLNKFPHYELNENANFESFNRLIKKFRIHPALSIGVRNTGLWRKFKTTKVFTLPEGPANAASYLSPGYGFTYYGWSEIEFNKGISLNGELMWWTSGYDRYLTGEPDIDLSYWEWQEFVEIPIYVKKYFHPVKNLLPYVAAGGGWLFMTKASGNVNNYSKKDDKNYIINNIDVLSMRNRNSLEWIAGAGIGYKIKNLRFFIEARYYGGLTSLTKSERRLDNETLVNDFHYIDNSVKMNKYEMGASIIYTFINSVKRLR